MSTDNPQNRDMITNEPGSHPVGTSVGTLAGVATGAVAGAIGGPAGVIIGAIAGGFAGGLAGHHVGEGVNPTEGLPPDDENVVGTGMGLTTGAIIGGTLGIPAGPIGVAVGAAIGSGVGGYVGGEAEEALDNRDKTTHTQHVHKHVEMTTHRPVVTDPLGINTNPHTIDPVNNTIRHSDLSDSSVNNAHMHTTTGYTSSPLGGHALPTNVNSTPSMNNTNHVEHPQVKTVSHTETTYVNKDKQI